MQKSPQSGFTFIELLTVLALAAILTAIAIPNLRDFMRNNRLTAAANGLLHSMYLARTEAIKRQTGNVVVCATADADLADAALTCNNGAFRAWFVFVDTNQNWTHEADGTEPVLEKFPSVDGTVTVKSDNSGIVSYGQTGFANPTAFGKTPTANVVFCDSRGNTTIQTTNSTARALFITNTGRVRVSRLKTEVDAAVTAAGNCPS